MSSLRSVLENSAMPDIYTCSVCGMKITLSVLTEHVLLHDQYSAFSYNETTKIIEPLDEAQEQQFQNQVPVPPSPPKATYTYFPNSYAFVPSAQSPRVDVPVTSQKTTQYRDDNVSPEIVGKPKSYSFVPHLQNKISDAPLDDLTGIQMIAKIAESLGKNETSETDENDAGDWTGENGKFNISKPLQTGDIVGTITLPFIENGTVGMSCECSIVFNRFINESKSEETGEEPCVIEMSLEDIIEDGEEEEEDFGEDYMDPDVPFTKKRKISLNTTARGGKAGRKMEVYKYKEAEAASDMQNELQNNIVPELLKDPAVVKYLETMTGKAIEPMNEDESQIVKDEIPYGTDQEAEHYEEMEEIDSVGEEANSTLNERNKILKETNSRMEEINSNMGEENGAVEKSNSTINERNSIMEQTNSIMIGKQNTEAGIEEYNSSQGCLSKEPPKQLVIEAIKTSSVNVNGDKEHSFTEKEDSQKERRNMIVVKLEQKTADTEEEDREKDSKHSEDATSMREVDDVDSDDAYSNDVAGSENDDSEQEMMDIESDIREANTCNENRIDNVSKKQLSLFSFKVEQFVEDVANEVKQKFSDKINIEKESASSSQNAKEDIGSSERDAFNDENVKRFSLADEKVTFCCSICEKIVTSFEALRHHFLTHKSHEREPRKSLRMIDKRLNILSQKVSDSLMKSTDECPSENSSDKLMFYCMICNIIFLSQEELTEHCKTHKRKINNREDILKPDGTSASDDTLTADSDVDSAMENENEFDTDKEIDKSKSLKRCSKRKNVRLNLEARGEVKRTRERLSDVNRKKTIRHDYICEYCGAGYLKLKECMEHMEQCNETGTLKCFQGCGYKFKTKSELDVHKRFCSRRLAYLDRINREMVKIENPEQEGDTNDFQVEEDTVDEIFECPYCEQKYKTDEKMRYHKLVCRKRPKQKCEQCNFECKGEKLMGKHLVEKHGLKPFKCEHCPRAFRLKGSLRDHTRYAHTKETYTCEFCGKSFIKQSLYRSHVSIQHQGFRLECSYCGKKFKDKRTWLMHENSHKGSYDYACDLCKKTFNRSELYRSHMQELHSIDGKAALSLNSAAKKLREELCANVCNICNEKFPLEAAYTLHMIKVHGQNVTVDSEVTI